MSWAKGASQFSFFNTMKNSFKPNTSSKTFSFMRNYTPTFSNTTSNNYQLSSFQSLKKISFSNKHDNCIYKDFLRKSQTYLKVNKLSKLNFVELQNNYAKILQTKRNIFRNGSFSSSFLFFE